MKFPKINLMPFWRKLAELLKLRKPKPPTVPPPVIVVPPPVPVVVLPRLVVRGKYFALETGEYWTAIENSDFNLLARFIKEGADAIRPVLAERQAFEFNLLRVWTRYGGDEVPEANRENFEREIGRLQPSEHPVYESLPAFCQLTAEYGLYNEFTAYCGGARGDHWERLGAALAGVTNAIVDGMNEADGYRHDVDIFSLGDLAGLLCTRGQFVQQHVPPRPWMQYETMHTNESSEWWRKGGHNGMELVEGDAEGHIEPSRVPLLVNENERPDKDPNIEHHEDAAAAAALLVAGSCFHSRSGKRSSLFDDFDKPYAEAFVRGCKSVPLEFQDGFYRPMHEDAVATGMLRIYRRVLPDGRYHEVRIRR